jgi:hypothetical protein
LEGGKGFGIAKEAGDADEKIAEEGADFLAMFLEVAKIIGGPFELVEGHAAINAAKDGAWFVL